MNIDEALKIVRQPAGSYRYPVLQKAWVTLADEVERLRGIERRAQEAMRGDPIPEYRRAAYLILGCPELGTEV
jgi:hypothetical protein